MHSFVAIAVTSALFFQSVISQTVTVDLGAPSAYITTTTANGPTLPTGTNVALFRNDNGDIDLYMGDDVRNDLTNRLKQKCATVNDDCDNSVQQGLLTSQYDLQSRQVGLVLALGGILLASFAYQLIELYKIDNKKLVPVRLNLASDKVASVLETSPAPEHVVFKTASNDPGLQPTVVPITGTTSINTATLTTGLTIATATDSANGHKKGDYKVTISDQKALSWLAKRATSWRCVRLRKRDGLSCAAQPASLAMGELNGDLANLLMIGGIRQLPRLVNGAALARDIQGVFAVGRALFDPSNIPDTILWTLAEFFLYQFDQVINQAADWVAEEFLSESLFEDQNEDPSAPASASGACSTGKNAPGCPDSDCSAPTDAATCTVKGPKSGCSCLPVITPPIDGVPSGWLNAQQSVFTAMSSMAEHGQLTGEAKPTCMADGAPWMLPTSYCNCGPSKVYPTLKPTGDGDKANCAYSTFPPDSQKITPTSNTATKAPTNIPGLNGVPGCAYVLYPNGQACVDADYCNCGGTPAPLLTTTVNGKESKNCNYPTVPSSHCPSPTTTREPPSRTTLSCNTGGPNNGGYKRFNRDKVAGQISKLCKAYVEGGVVLSWDGDHLPPTKYTDTEIASGMSEGDSEVIINPNYAKNGCEDPDTDDPTPWDFKAKGQQKCEDAFMRAVDGCPEFKNPNGDEYWKWGGQNQFGCLFWNVNAQ